MAPDHIKPEARGIDDLDGPDWWEAHGIPVPPPMTEEEEAAADARAEADTAAGRLIPHEQVVEWLKTWGTPDERPMPPEWRR